MLDLFFTNIAYADDVDVFIGNVNRVILNPIIYLLFALALVFFLYGVLEFLMNQENDEKKTVGKSHMLWGIIGIGIMFSVWAILNIILGTLGITGIDPEKGTVELNDYDQNLPQLNNNSTSPTPGKSTPTPGGGYQAPVQKTPLETQ